LTQRAVTNACVEVAVVHLPHLANFDEFGLMAAEPGVSMRYVSRPEELRAPDLVILPGSKATIPDLVWLNDRGLSERVRWLAAHGTPVLGICGGYQMLGRVVRDPEHLESECTNADGLALLPIETELGGAKRLVRTRGRGRADAAGVWAALSGVEVTGYEIHVGRTWGAQQNALFDLPTGRDGSISDDGLVAGTYLHGILEQAPPRHALLQALARARGFTFRPAPIASPDVYDQLADVLQATLQLPTTRVPTTL
jgi:adenosylcobyric acid synthase